MRGAAGLAWLAAIGALGVGLVVPQNGEGQVRSVSGTLRSVVTFDEQRVGGFITQRADRRQDYSLGVQGLILDPRLATFQATGTFAGNNPVLGHGAKNRAVSGGLNLNMLPFSRIPLSLRHFQSHGWGGASSDTMSSGLTWQVSHPLYPSLSLNVERSAVQTGGPSPTETTFLGGTLGSTYHREDLDLFGEVGARRTEDAVRRTSTMSQFANLSGTYKPTAATNLQGAANYFQDGQRLTARVNASLTNRPDPSVTRDANASIRFTQIGGASTYSLDAGGNLKKNYLLAADLQAFLTAGGSFAGDVVGGPSTSSAGGVGQGPGKGFFSLTASSGGGVTYSGFRYVLATADSVLTALYEKDGQQGMGVRGTFHTGLKGRNLGPMNLGVDYIFRGETGVVNTMDHTVSVSLGGNIGAPFPVIPSLTVEPFLQAATSMQQGGPAATGSGGRVSLTGGGRATYTGVPFLTWGLMTQVDTAISGQFETHAVTTRTILTYTPVSGLWASLIANRSDTLSTGETRHSAQADISYRIGMTLLGLNYSLDLTSGRGQTPISQRVMFTTSRPFGWRVR